MVPVGTGSQRFLLRDGVFTGQGDARPAVDTLVRGMYRPNLDMKMDMAAISQLCLIRDLALASRLPR